jgi:hypothetical protein
VPLWKIDAEGIQHRIAALLVLALGALEWRARARPDRRSLLSYVFPALGAAGAVLLLTHSHAAFQSKQSFLVQVTHTTMGALAALLVAGRWLELRLAPPAGRLAGAVATAAMLMIALVLLFYREANVLIPPDCGVPVSAPSAAVPRPRPRDRGGPGPAPPVDRRSGAGRAGR